jgi:hypothetical protein
LNLKKEGLTWRSEKHTWKSRREYRILVEHMKGREHLEHLYMHGEIII